MFCEVDSLGATYLAAVTNFFWKVSTKFSNDDRSKFDVDVFCLLFPVPIVLVLAKTSLLNTIAAIGHVTRVKTSPLILTAGEGGAGGPPT